MLDPIIIEWHKRGHRCDWTPWGAQTARAEEEIVGHIEWQREGTETRGVDIRLGPYIPIGAGSVPRRR